ncbi:hypothetical protein Tsubulata_012240 [Turnera subulata]|uniref:DUF4283 domain-containing protein n=1 Tax=Turnera subulata TaxID=218843 RepID=A0A9Q0JMV3_9ROSI|nr:hypothetical protein Tsubulata_012240 [Turnera subulata]
MLWKPTGSYQIIDLVNNYFVARFANDVDYENVLLNGPWVVYGHAIYVQPWTDNFWPSTDTIKHVVVWVQFPDYPLGRYHSRILRILGNLVGRTVKIDSNMAQSKRGKFAKVAVAVDLSKPLKDAVYLQKEQIRVCYEGLPPICQTCGLIGHNPSLCPLIQCNSEQTDQPQSESSLPTNTAIDDLPPRIPASPQPAATPKNLGDWVNVPIKERKPLRKPMEPRVVNQQTRDGPSGSRFDVLADTPAANPFSPPQGQTQSYSPPNPPSVFNAIHFKAHPKTNNRRGAPALQLNTTTKSKTALASPSNHTVINLDEAQHKTIVTPPPPATTLYHKPPVPMTQTYTKPSQPRKHESQAISPESLKLPPSIPPDPGNQHKDKPPTATTTPSMQPPEPQDLILPMECETSASMEVYDVTMEMTEDSDTCGAHPI